MKIAYLAQHFWPETGALPARIGEMALRWQAAGAQIRIFTGMPHRPEGRIHAEYKGKLFLEEEWEGIRIHRSWLYASPKHGFARTIVNNLSFMSTSTLNALRSERPDVMIASAPPFFVHLAGDAVRRMWKAPLVLELRDLWPDYLVGMGILKGRVSPAALFRLERYLLQRASKVVVVTEPSRARVGRKGVPPDRIEVVPNAVDTDLYYRTSEPAPVQDLERGPGDFVVGYLGNFGAGQGLETVLEAAVVLSLSHPHIRFVLAGDGTQKEQVARKAADLRLTNLAMHPPIAKDRTRAFYNACDVCLVPLAPFSILQETIPSKIFEIMACERPVLASVGGEAARIVSESGSGLVTEPGNAAGIADGIRQLESFSTEERDFLGRNGRRFVERNYNRTILADKYLDILLDLAGRTRSTIMAREHTRTREVLI
jgi:glycosyltransferase involved in cell wall biosynthesis